MDNEGTMSPNTPRFIDLRRHDELALFGQIPGSLHLQVQEWPKALAMDSRAWEQSFKFPKLGNDDLVILHCMDCLLFCFSLHKLIMLSQDFITMMGGHVQSSPLADKSAVSHRFGF
jgi:hypothetical protein